MFRSIIRSPVLAAACLLFLPRVVVADISLVTVTPPYPTDRDAVTVTIDAAYPDLCWEVEDCSCGSLATDALFVLRLTVVDHAGPGVLCQDQPGAYSFRCALGELPPGNYRVEVSEVVRSSRVPQGDSVEAEFQVAGHTPATPLTWGRLKVIRAGD